MVAGRDAEVKAGAVDDTRRKGHSQLMLLQLMTASLTPRTGLGPGLTAAAARVARASYGHLKGQHSAKTCFLPRHLHGCTQRGCALVGYERVSHAIDSRSHRRKVDDDLVSKTAPVLLARPVKRNASDPPRHVSTHEQ